MFDIYFCFFFVWKYDDVIIKTIFYKENGVKKKWNYSNRVRFQICTRIRYPDKVFVFDIRINPDWFEYFHSDTATLRRCSCKLHLKKASKLIIRSFCKCNLYFGLLARRVAGSLSLSLSLFRLYFRTLSRGQLSVLRFQNRALSPLSQPRLVYAYALTRLGSKPRALQLFGIAPFARRPLCSSVTYLNECMLFEAQSKLMFANFIWSYPYTFVSRRDSKLFRRHNPLKRHTFSRTNVAGKSRSIDTRTKSPLERVVFSLGLSKRQDGGALL